MTPDSTAELANTATCIFTKSKSMQVPNFYLIIKKNETDGSNLYSKHK